MDSDLFATQRDHSTTDGNRVMQSPGGNSDSASRIKARGFQILGCAGHGRLQPRLGRDDEELVQVSDSAMPTVASLMVTLALSAEQRSGARYLRAWC